MSPIAPRYRGPNTSSDDSQVALNPILTIPDLAPIEADPVTQSQAVSNDVSPEQVESRPGSELTTDEDSTPTGGGGSEPLLGSMQESIKRITDRAIHSIKQVGKNNSFNPVETVRGILPGIVISISIACLWWIIGRSSPSPVRQDLARETQNMQEMINPIAQEPLRATDQVGQRRADDGSAVATDTGREGQLFDHVPFINRPANETVSQSNSPPEASTTVTPANDGPQAQTRPTTIQSGFPPATQRDVANAKPNASPAAQTDVRRPTVPGRKPVDAADRSTEFEWPRDEARVAQQNTGPPSSDARRDRGTVPSRDGQILTQRTDHERPVESRQPQGPYSYQQTDPSTYKDPVYSVPPVARRARRAQR